MFSDNEKAAIRLALRDSEWWPDPSKTDVLLKIWGKKIVVTYDLMVKLMMVVDYERWLNDTMFVP